MEKFNFEENFSVVYNYEDEFDGKKLDDLAKEATLVLSGDKDNYIENGNIIGGINFPDLDMDEKVGKRIAIFSDSFINPLLDVMEMFSNFNIQTEKIKTVRREDGISYTLAEVKGDIPGIDFSELPNILKARVI